VKDCPRNGQIRMQRTDADVDKVRTLVSSNRRLCVRLIAEEFNMNEETVPQTILEDLEMR
jgi:hypothetical protein